MSCTRETQVGLTRTLEGSTALPSDFFALLKPRVMSLVVLTALTGLITAPGHLNPVLGIAALIAIAVGAGASGALNMWFDADIDALMRRTRNRPIPSGKIQPREALTFGSVLSVLSVLTLGVVANWLAAGLLAATILFYACIYTMWLKRSTPQNIVIGGAAGAMPPMIGCAAASGTLSLDSAVLFAIIFLWTPPHFWALALARSEDYAKAGIPMMPNVLGFDRTGREILFYSLVLVPVACLPWFVGSAGPVYGMAASICGGMFLYRAWRTYRSRQDAAKRNKVAMQLFGFSILYLFVLFTVLVVERIAVLVVERLG